MNNEVKQNITLLATTPNPRKVLFTAIRTCYSHLYPEEIYNAEFNVYEARKAKDGGPGTDVDRLIRLMKRKGHTSTFEHVNFTFALEGVSRSLLAQLTRHRVGVAYSVQSQRYVTDKSEGKKGGFKYVVPPKVKEQPYANRIFALAMEKAQEFYDLLVKDGIPGEDARFVLPNAAGTNITFTVNLRELLHLHNLRTGKGVQWEIKALAETLRREVEKAEPWTIGLFESE